MKFLHNISRIEAFSDAVFAFGATLMVVSLSDKNSASVLNIDLVSFIGFFVSFFVLVLLWKAHYNFFRRTQYVDNWIIAVNSMLLFVVLYFVFPLKSMINSMFIHEGLTLDKLAALFMLYGIAILLIFLCFSFMYYWAYRKDKTLTNSMDLLFYARHFLIFVIVAFCSILLAAFDVLIRYGGPGFVYFLLGPLCHYHAVWFEKNIRNKIIS